MTLYEMTILKQIYILTKHKLQVYLTYCEHVKFVNNPLHYQINYIYKTQTIINKAIIRFTNHSNLQNYIKHLASGVMSAEKSTSLSKRKRYTINEFKLCSAQSCIYCGSV